MFVVVKLGHPEPEAELAKGVVSLIRSTIGAIATPKAVKVVPDLPKTRSGKIMRRILRKIAANEFEDLGDTSTLANPEVVKKLIEIKKKNPQ